MTTKVLRFITIMFVSLSMGMAFCHLLEMPVRLGYEPALWSRVTNVENTYRFFGPPIGALIESGAWLTAVVLTVVLRKRRAFWPTLIGAAFMVAAHITWWAFVFPVNNQMIDWTPERLPADFPAWRDQWEYAHAGRAVLQIIALGALVISVLVDTPETEAGSRRANAIRQPAAGPR